MTGSVCFWQSSWCLTFPVTQKLQRAVREDDVLWLGIWRLPLSPLKRRKGTWGKESRVWATRMVSIRRRLNTWESVKSVGLDLLVEAKNQKKLNDCRRTVQPLLNALRFVESSNHLHCPDGDNGLSIGPLQISELYHLDAWKHKKAYAWILCRYGFLGWVSAFAPVFFHYFIRCRKHCCCRDCMHTDFSVSRSRLFSLKVLLF